MTQEGLGAPRGDPNLPPPPTTEELLAVLEQQIDTLEDEIVKRDFTKQVLVTETDRFGNEVAVRDAQGNIVFTEEADSDRFDDTVTALAVLLDRRTRDFPDASPRTLSPNVAAQITEQRAARQQAGEEFQQREQRLGEETEARGQREEAALEESQRATNILATLDLMENEIRIGNLNVAEATNRLSAATSAAGIQRDVLSRFGGQNLPAGTEFFPNLGPTGPIASAAAALGLPFEGFSTMGTFGVNPAQLAGTIPSALGPSAVPGVRGDQQAILAAAAGLGLPPPTPAGRQARTPQMGQQQAALSLAGLF